LKTAFNDLLPMGFSRGKWASGSISRWFRNELKDYINDILLDPRTLNRGYFKREGVQSLLKDHLESRYDHSAKIWALLFLEMWFRVFIDREGDFLLDGT
jgi:asparagine synthase (glutamine-hydrolysing)